MRLRTGLKLLLFMGWSWAVVAHAEGRSETKAAPAQAAAPAHGAASTKDAALNPPASGSGRDFLALSVGVHRNDPLKGDVYRQVEDFYFSGSAQKYPNDYPRAVEATWNWLVDAYNGFQVFLGAGLGFEDMQRRRSYGPGVLTLSEQVFYGTGALQFEWPFSSLIGGRGAGWTFGGVLGYAMPLLPNYYAVLKAPTGTKRYSETDGYLSPNRVRAAAHIGRDFAGDWHASVAWVATSSGLELSLARYIGAAHGR